ncbi:unnamed protein product [Symbiodinium microadriaticum]|nr:unnamed protein product [Symbiodinium microadriaticum]
MNLVWAGVHVDRWWRKLVNAATNSIAAGIAVAFLQQERLHTILGNEVGHSEFGHCKFQVINFTVLDEVGVMNGKAHLQQQLAETRGFPAINKATIMQMLQVVLCSDLRMVTVATFDRHQLPTLALASNSFVASRFHTVMRHFGIPEPQVAESEADTPPTPPTPPTPSQALPTPSANSASPASEIELPVQTRFVDQIRRASTPASHKEAPAAVRPRDKLLEKLVNIMAVAQLDESRPLQYQGWSS